MEVLKEYWAQILAFITVVMAITTMKVDIENIKQKIKVKPLNGTSLNFRHCSVVFCHICSLVIFIACSVTT